MELTSRFLILVPLTAQDCVALIQAIIAVAGLLPDTIKRSLTWDCGSEAALHADASATGLPVYFAHPTARGSEAATKTSTASSASSSPKAPRSPTTRNASSSKSTAGHAKYSTGKHQQNYSPNSQHKMLRPLEIALSYYGCTRGGK